MFDSGRAAATATAIYDVQLDPEIVTIVIATVELVPGYGSTASSREHEDGHALINRRVAQRCAAEALSESVRAGYRGTGLIGSIITQLSAAGDPVHARYHEYVDRAQYGQHIRAAERALTEITGCSDRLS